MSSKKKIPVIKKVSAGIFHVDDEVWNLGSRYELTEFIAGGSYGTVCKAADGTSGAGVAIKRIQGVFNNRTNSTRCMRELRILRMLSCPAIINMTDVLLPPPSPEPFNDLYLIFEHCETDLYKLMKSRRKLTEKDTRHILYQMLVGIRHMHRAHLIHRDLKPANILIKDVSALDIRIADFGLAREIFHLDPQDRRYSVPTRPNDPSRPPPGEDPQDDDRRSYSVHVVTRWYRAPEVILSEGSYDCALDVWSIGCIFGELMGLQYEPHVYTPMFPGRSCYPMSPSANARTAFDEREQHDQLNVIFEVIGTPSEDVIAAHPDAEVRQYLAGIPPQPNALHEFFPDGNPDALHLLNRMLDFDPDTRISTDQALDHPYFKNYKAAPDTALAARQQDVPVVHIDFEERIKAQPTRSTLRAIATEEITAFHKK